jgi:hypothetical protein
MCKVLLNSRRFCSKAGVAIGLVLLTVAQPLGANGQFDVIEGLGGAMPKVGDSAMRLLTPGLLEISRINTQPSGGSPSVWNFVSSGTFNAPAAESFQVNVNGLIASGTISGFRRRPLYAPIAARDLRIDNRIFISLDNPVAEGAEVTVTTTAWEGGTTTSTYTAVMSPARRSPAIHVNHEGYATASPKQAMVGYYLGSQGEMDLPSTSFALVDHQSGQTVFSGAMSSRPDVGYACSPLPYQKVAQADFSAFQTPGVYHLVVPGLGTSLPFRICDDMLMNFVRTYAQGIYNQRCGHAVELPFSRHTHAPCHTAAAEIPLPQANFPATWSFLSSANSDAVQNPRHTAAILSTEAAQLYPILKTGAIDVSGGHHDAGDYSKYTINSAQLIHHLAFAADAFPGVGALDNLGIPESGDGKSDILQEAKIEADFLAKMQDDDGGFFFLVYPKTRKYEDDVLPDHGDSQVVWPKNTAATAAAVGALADIGSSPLFKQQFPAASALYLQKAQAGWAFLLNAIATHGKDGSYQKLTHYGDLFMHDDELAWAAAAMFAATGDPVCQQKLSAWYDPLSSSTWRWGWWGLFEGYGCAARSYAFAEVTGKRAHDEMDAGYLAKAKQVILDEGNAILQRSQQGAYGSCLDTSSKRQQTAGWFFCSDRTFDISASQGLFPNSQNEIGVIGGANYEFGCNPLNLSYMTGAGQRQQFEIVHQYAQNDDRVMPPSGIPIGNIQSGFSWNGLYTSELGRLTFPSDGASSGAYPAYDRWGDTFNTATEFVIANQARGLAGLAAWAAQANGAAQAWHPPAASISVPTDYVTAEQPLTVAIICPGVDLSSARVTWESGDQDPVIAGNIHTFVPHDACRQWIEAEAVLPDGRRVSAAATFGVKVPQGASEFSLTDETIALYHFNGNYQDASPNAFNLTVSGNPQLVDQACGWMEYPAGKSVLFSDIGDKLVVTIPDAYLAPGSTTTPLTIEAWICPLEWKAHGKSNDPVISLNQSWDIALGVSQDMWISPACPFVSSGNGTIASGQQWHDAVTPGIWQRLKITREATSEFKFYVNEMLVSSFTPSTTPNRTNDWTLTIGNFRGYMDDVRITGMPNHGVATTPPGGGSGGGGTPPVIVPAGSVVSPFNWGYEPDSETIALYHFDGNYADSGPDGFHLTPSGNATLVPSCKSSGLVLGNVLRLRNMGDFVGVTIPDVNVMPGNTAVALTLEAWILPRAYKHYGVGGAGILDLYQNWDSSVGIIGDKWLSPSAPLIKNGGTTIFSNSEWSSQVTLNAWHHLRITRDSSSTARFWLDGVCLKTITVPMTYGRTNDWTFTIGDVDADIDEVRLSRVVRPLEVPDRFAADGNTLALYHFDGDYDDSSGNAYHLTKTGNTKLIDTNLDWMRLPAGKVARFADLGDTLTTSLPDSLVSPGSTCTPMTIEAWVYPRAYKAWSKGNYPLVSMFQWWDSALEIMQKKWGQYGMPMAHTGNGDLVTPAMWRNNITLNNWQYLKMTRNELGVFKFWVNGGCINTVTARSNFNRANDWLFTLGNMDADIDEVRISNIVR